MKSSWLDEDNYIEIRHLCSLVDESDFMDFYWHIRDTYIGNANWRFIFEVARVRAEIRGCIEEWFCEEEDEI